MNGLASPDATTSGSAKSNIRKHLDHSSVAAETNGDKNGGNDADSEAETLITSPVKQKEAAKRNAVDSAHSEENAHNNTKRRADLDEEADANGSSEDEITLQPRKVSSASVPKHDFSDDNDSDSEISSNASIALREWDQNATRNGASSPNPRKRKHRASSISLPNKRPSVDGARRRLRGSEGPSHKGRSESPRNRGHRRAASTQSFLENEPKKRRSGNNLTGRRGEWEESSVSSEATSHGQHEARRPQRGVGRATATPGRPAGREHKRYINRYGFTRLAEACESGDLDAVKEWRMKDPDQVEMAEYAGNKPLQIAALAGNVEVVKYLIEQGCRVDCANDVHDTPLIDAAENGHLDVIEVLLAAGVNPRRKSGKGQQALDVVNDDTDNATEIRAVLRKAMESWDTTDQAAGRDDGEEEMQQRIRAGPAKALEILGRTPEVLQQLVAINDRNGVQECLDARVPVDNSIITSAAKTGDIYLLNMLLAEMTDKKRHQKPEKPLLGVIGTSHFEMVKALTELEQFRALWTNRQGQTWSQIAAEKAGPNCKQEVELFRQLESQAGSKTDDKRSSSPVVSRSSVHKQKRPSISKDADVTDETMEDSTPRQRKNGRRLLSRKDMRAANGKQVDSSDESESEDARESARPTEKRGPGRPKSAKPIVIKKEDDKETDSARRRSTPHKSGVDNTLASVPETNEESTMSSSADPMDIDVDVAVPQNKASATKRTQKTTGSTSKEKESSSAEDRDIAKQQAEMSRQLAAEQEQARLELERLELERREAKKKEAEIKQREAEAKMKEAAEAKKRAEELEKKRKAEEERLAEIEHGRAEARQQVLRSLPGVLSVMLDSASAFTFDDQESVHALLTFCEPLQVVYMSDLAPRDSEHDQYLPMVLNLAVAPLLGKDIGLFTLLPDHMLPYGQATVSQNLPGIALSDEERLQVLGLIRDGPLSRALLHQPDPEHISSDKDLSFERQMAVTAALMNKRSEVINQLESATFVYRWLSLQKVIDMLHPALRSLTLRAREDWRSHLQQALRPAVPSSQGFFGEIKNQWSIPRAEYLIRHGQNIGQQRSSSISSSTAVTVIHSK